MRKARKGKNPVRVDRGERFRALRLRLNFATQAELEAASGVAQSQISRLESGSRSVSLDSAVRLAEAMNVSLDVLVGRVAADPAGDRYPSRAPVVASPEFAAAPEPVRQKILDMHESEWSTALWARVFWAALDMHNAEHLSDRGGEQIDARLGATSAKQLQRKIDR